MRRLYAGLRHRPATFAGTFFSLVVSAAIVTLLTSLTVAALRFHEPAQRLAGASVVVLGTPTVPVSFGSGSNASTDPLPLNDYRRLPAAVSGRLEHVPGVEAAIPDVSIPLALVLPGGQIAATAGGETINGHGWASARLAPFRLRRGTAPLQDDEMVVGAGLAQRYGIGLGEHVQLAGEGLGPFVVSGIATSPGDPAQDWTVFFSGAEAAVLYAHPGEADLVGVIATPGTPPAQLAERIRSSLRGSGLHVKVLSGSQLGNAENLVAAPDASQLAQSLTSVGVDIAIVALFVVAAAVSLSVAERRRNLALLRAVGATPGQVRRGVLAELVIIGLLGGLAGYWPGLWAARAAMRGVDSHQLMPPSARTWTSPWLLLVAAGTGTVVAVVSGLVAARRAARIRPSAALAEAKVERQMPHPVRLLLGLGALAGAGALCYEVVSKPLSAVARVNDAFDILLASMAAVALLGPLLVVLAELVLRVPLRLLGGVTARLASGDVRRRSRRAASATVSIALAIAFVGAIFVVDDTIAHDSAVQSRQRLRAAEVVSAPGPGLAPGALRSIEALPAVRAAVALTPTTVFLAGAGQTVTEAVTPGPIGSLLDLDVTAGSLRDFGPGDIALSTLLADQYTPPGRTTGVRVGEHITVWLADGTPYRATLRAIYSRSLGFSDAIIPQSAAGGGHLGTSMLGEVLVGEAGAGGLAAELASLQERYPGLQATSRDVLDAEADLQSSQGSWANNVALGLLALLAGAALVNTLVMTTIEGRGSLSLLERLGTTNRQLLASAAWQTAVVSILGLVLGVACAGFAVAVVAKALDGSYLPYLAWRPLTVIGGTALALTATAILVPTGILVSGRSRRSV